MNKSMNFLKTIWGSTLGRKYLMAVSGVALFLFLIGHLAGNLQVFLGPDAINHYAEFLHSKPAMVWAARLGLMVLVAVHIWSAATLTLENRAARPVVYAARTAPVAASYASRTMMVSGLIIASFVIYHLLHFTVQAPAINLISDPAVQDFTSLRDATGRADVFRMMIVGFSSPWVAGFYVLAMALLCLHLSHGLSAMVQTMGWRECCPVFFDRAAAVVALLIFLGYTSIPVAILVFGYGTSSAQPL